MIDISCRRDELDERRRNSGLAAHGTGGQRRNRHAIAIDNTGDALMLVERRCRPRIRAHSMVTRDDEKTVRICLLHFMDKPRHDLIHVPVMAEFLRQRSRIPGIGNELAHLLLHLCHIEPLRREIDVVGRMIRCRHDEVHGRRLIGQMRDEGLKEILIVRAPGIRLWRTIIRIAIEMIESLCQRHAAKIVPIRRTAVPEIHLIAQRTKLLRQRRGIRLLVAARLIIRPRAGINESCDYAADGRRGELTRRHEIRRTPARRSQ